VELSLLGLRLRRKPVSSSAWATGIDLPMMTSSALPRIAQRDQAISLELLVADGPLVFAQLLFGMPNSSLTGPGRGRSGKKWTE